MEGVIGDRSIATKARASSSVDLELEPGAPRPLAEHNSQLVILHLVAALGHFNLHWQFRHGKSIVLPTHQARHVEAEFPVPVGGSQLVRVSSFSHSFFHWPHFSRISWPPNATHRKRGGWRWRVRRVARAAKLRTAHGCSSRAPDARPGSSNTQSRAAPSHSNCTCPRSPQATLPSSRTSAMPRRSRSYFRCTRKKEKSVRLVDCPR